MKARLLFPGTAFAIGVIAFAVGYQIPGSLPAVPNKVEQVPDVSQVSTDHASVEGNSSAWSRENLRVEGFAEIGFAELEELLTTSSLPEREQWAEELGALPDRPMKPIALIAFYTAWLDLKPEEALRSLQKFPDLLYRINVFSAFPSAVPNRLLPQLLDVISEFSEVERRVLLPSYLTTLAETDPAATARFLDSHPKLVLGSDAAALMSTWAQDDVDEAKKWLEGSRFSTDSDVLRSLVDSWLGKDPAAARSYVLLLRDNPAIEPAAESVAGNLFNISPEQTREFISAFGDQRAAYLLRELISSVSDNQVANLATWASTFPDSIAEGNVGYALARWSSLDPGQALSWLASKPALERESLIVQMIGSEIAPASPEIVALAYKISDAQKRDEALSILVRSLADETGDAAERIRALGLSPSQTKHLLELRPASTE